MSDVSRTFSPGRALDAVTETARMLTGASLDDVVATAPVLVLRALSCATRVDLTVTLPGRAQPVTASASHDAGPAMSVAPGDSRVLALQLALHDLPGTGTLVVSTSAAEGFVGISALAAELLAVQVESSLDRAYCRELIEGFIDVIHTERDLGVAVGILMATRGLTRDAALGVLHELSTGSGIGVVAAELIAHATPGEAPTQLRLVRPLDP